METQKTEMNGVKALFKEAENTQAFLKAGFLGFNGSGKTFTATQLAIGLHQRLGLKSPIFFADTETGSDWMKPIVEAAGIKLYTAKTRAFSDLVPLVREVEKEGGIGIFDSMTHFWRELTESYMKKKGKSRLAINDWGYLKNLWGEFTDAFVNSSAHLIICGRAGYEYDYFEDDDGKKQMEKTGIKMKAEGEMGYEPSLLILMERMMNLETKEDEHMAHVIKDRSTRLDGKHIKDPEFKHFIPHIEYLNIGGKQLGVDLTRNSQAMIGDANADRSHEMREREIVLNEIETLLVEHYPSQKTEDKLAKIQHLKNAFGTAAWERIKTFNSATLKAAYASIKSALGPVRSEEESPETVLELE